MALETDRIHGATDAAAFEMIAVTLEVVTAGPVIPAGSAVEGPTAAVVRVPAGGSEIVAAIRFAGSANSANAFGQRRTAIAVADLADALADAILVAECVRIWARPEAGPV